MMTKQEVISRQQQAFDMFQKAGLVITADEKKRIEIVDCNLNQFETIGLGLLVYLNTERCCAKELAIWPRQTCPQHLHPPVNGEPGKEETFRCRWGTMFLYVPGEVCPVPHAKAPLGRENTFTVWHEIVLNPGNQYTLAPGTWHWFQADHKGAVVSEFSTKSTDEHDIFKDTEIQRFTKIID